MLLPKAPPLRVPEMDRAAALLFIINAASGEHDSETTRQLIEAALRTSGRTGELLFSHPENLAQVAQQAASAAYARHGAVVAVGGDGTINSVAQAAHAQGCVMGVLPQGTFNYFTRTHGVPLLSIPGNHDVPLFNLMQRLFDPYAHYSAAFGAELEPVHCSSDLLVVGVNTTRWYRHKNGEVSLAQIEQVTKHLRTATPQQLRVVVVVVHQPVAVRRASEAHNLLRGHAAALQHWAAAGCDLVMGGHIHLPYVLPLAGLARPMWAVQAGTAVSKRVREGAPNSVNLLRWGGDAAPGCCMIEQWDYTASAQAFVRIRVTEARPGLSGAAARER